jgi:FtsP/CotA-like multicopper oxidase with cupredoxin domain
VPGALVEAPAIDVASLPVDDLGQHELILRVRHDGDRFCFHYIWNGAEQNVAPTLRTHRGDHVALRLVNEISGPAMGATIKASEMRPCTPTPMAAAQSRPFSGYLNHTIYARSMPMKPLDVNLHMHGFEGPAEQENVFLSTLSTPMHACEYTITIPRSQPPGTYFYHPHAHGMTNDEVAGGLFGTWIVEPDTVQISRSDEHVITLHLRVPFVSDNPAADKELDTKAQAIVPLIARYESSLKLVPPLTNYDPFNPPLWTGGPVSGGGQSADVWNDCGAGVGGAFLNVAVNGVDAPARLSVRADRTQLLRILDATPMDPKLLRIRDASGTVQTMRVVGRDGIPVGNDNARPLARYVPMNSILLGPSSRADILLTLHAGQTVTLYSDRVCLGALGGIALTHDLLTIVADGDAKAATSAVIASSPLAANESHAVQLLRYARAHRDSVRRRALTYTQYTLPNPNGKGLHAESYITETSNRDFHEHPYWPDFRSGKNTPAHADIVVKRGSIEEWYLFNTTLLVHTFHIHQMTFAAENEQPFAVMLDNVVVPAGKAVRGRGDQRYPMIKPGVTRILLDFRNVPRGEFVYHCHMLGHEDEGMMGVIRVI